MAANAYDTRLAVLEMARGLLTDEFYIRDQESREGRGSKDLTPTFPTTEEIIERATKLYTFIENRPTSGKTSMHSDSTKSDFGSIFPTR